MRHDSTPTYTADDVLDLSRDWDASGCGSDAQHFRAWLEKERPHLLRAYDADFLVRAAESARAQRPQTVR